MEAGSGRTAVVNRTGSDAIGEAAIVDRRDVPKGLSDAIDGSGGDVR